MTKNLRNTTIPHMLPSLVRTLVVVSFLLGGMAAYTKAQADTTTIFPGPIVPGQIRITMVTLDPETLEIPVDGFTSSEAFTLSIGIRNLNSTSRLIPPRLNFKIFEEDPVDPVASPTGSEPSGEGEVLFNHLRVYSPPLAA